MKTWKTYVTLLYQYQLKPTCNIITICSIQILKCCKLFLKFLFPKNLYLHFKIAFSLLSCSGLLRNWNNDLKFNLFCMLYIDAFWVSLIFFLKSSLINSSTFCNNRSLQSFIYDALFQGVVKVLELIISSPCRSQTWALPI